MAFGFDLTILGAGVRDAAAFRDAVAPAGLPSLTPQEQDDLAAFEREGWRFGRDVGAPRRRDLPEAASGVEAGVLARRPDGGLAIVQNRLVVALQSSADAERLLSQYSPWEKLPFGDDLFTFNVSPEEDDLEGSIERTLEALKRNGGPAVRWVEPVFTFHLQAPPPTPPAPGLHLKQLFFMTLAALTPAYDSAKQWQWPLIQLSQAWDKTRGAGTVVAVIDDGFFLTPQLPGSDAILSLDANGNIRTPALPGAYHGTFCAALVGSPSDRSLGNGVAPECSLLLVAVSNVMNSDGFAAALKECANRGADVITCSLGPHGGKWMNLKTLQSAIDDVQKNGRQGKGTVVVWAVSNNEELIRNTDLESYAPLLCVGPGDEKDRRGPSGHGNGLDLIAPGIGVRGLLSDDGRTFEINARDSGSSFATPIVAGVAALVIAVNPNLKWDQVVDIIQRSCDKRPPRPPSADLGWGRVNALSAVTAALR